MKELYEQIFRRKSFHRFSKPFKPLAPLQLLEIEQYAAALKPLVGDIRTRLRIVRVEQTTCRQGEYALLFYSEKKQGYLQNIGYIGQQLDLHLAKLNIGSCWYGMGRPQERECEGLQFVCMMCIANQDEAGFRTATSKLTRLDEKDIWEGEDPCNLAAVVKLAPSACNTQPWLVQHHGNQLAVFRVFRKRGIIPRSHISYYQSIDIGIFLLFLELAMEHQGLSYTRKLVMCTQDADCPVPMAEYVLEG